MAKRVKKATTEAKEYHLVEYSLRDHRSCWVHILPDAGLTIKSLQAGLRNGTLEYDRDKRVIVRGIKGRPRKDVVAIVKGDRSELFEKYSKPFGFKLALDKLGNPVVADVDLPG